jgi:hypothetical protein
MRAYTQLHALVVERTHIFTIYKKPIRVNPNENSETLSADLILMSSAYMDNHIAYMDMRTCEGVAYVHRWTMSLHI